MYGLKQSPRMWYQKFDTYMLGLCFTRRKEDHCVYFKLIGDHLTYLVLYVDVADRKQQGDYLGCENSVVL